MSIYSDVNTALGIERPSDPLSLPALTLAYIGDTIYDLYVRTLLAETVQAQVHTLHTIAAKHVCAAGQAADYRIATGLEALLGYLYLTGEDARIGELMHAALEQFDDSGKETER